MSKYSRPGIYSYCILGGVVGGGVFGLVNSVRHSLRSEFGFWGSDMSIKHESIPMRIGLTTIQIMHQTLSGVLIGGTFAVCLPIILPIMVPATLIVVATKD